MNAQEQAQVLINEIQSVEFEFKHDHPESGSMIDVDGDIPDFAAKKIAVKMIDQMTQVPGTIVEAFWKEVKSHLQ